MDAYRVQRRRRAASAGSLQRQSNFVPPPRPLRFEPPRDGMAEVREFSVNVAAIGISDDRGDTANKRWCFLSERFFKNPSKGLFIANSRGSRLPPPVCLVVSSMFRRNLVAKLPVNPVEAFCAFVTQSDGEFAKAGAIVFPQCAARSRLTCPEERTVLLGCGSGGNEAITAFQSTVSSRQSLISNVAAEMCRCEQRSKTISRRCSRQPMGPVSTRGHFMGPNAPRQRH